MGRLPQYWSVLVQWARSKKGFWGMHKIVMTFFLPPLCSWRPWTNTSGTDHQSHGQDSQDSASTLHDMRKDESANVEASVASDIEKKQNDPDKDAHGNFDEQVAEVLRESG